jgi:hypothetical protein
MTVVDRIQPLARNDDVSGGGQVGFPDWQSKRPCSTLSITGTDMCLSDSLVNSGYMDAA